MENEQEIRERIRRSILAAFDKWGAQNFDVLFDSATRKENPEKIERRRLEDTFMIRRVHDIGFFRYVTQQVLASEDCQRQLRTITRAAILSILHPTISVGELETKSDDDDLYTRRHLQDLVRNIYSETFFEADKNKKQKAIPDTVGAYSTVFSPHVEPKLDNPTIVNEFQAFDRLVMDSNPEFKAGVELNARVQPAMPEYLRNFTSFKTLCREILTNIGDYSTTGKILAEELCDITPSFSIFHNHMLSILSVEWYRSRQEATRKALLEELHPLEYSEEDAGLVAKYLLELFGSEESVANVVQDVCQGFALYKRLDVCLLLYRECIKLNGLNPLYKGVLHENLAVVFRDIQPPKPKLMVSEMKKAVELYRQSGNLYRVCVALKNLGEAEWKLGYKELGMDYFGEARATSAKLSQSDRAGVLLNLAVSARRVCDKQLETKFLAECLTYCPEDWTERILAINERLQELSR